MRKGNIKQIRNYAESLVYSKVIGEKTLMNKKLKALYLVECISCFLGKFLMQMVLLTLCLKLCKTEPAESRFMPGMYCDLQRDYLKILYMPKLQASKCPEALEFQMPSHLSNLTSKTVSTSWRTDAIYFKAAI